MKLSLVTVMRSSSVSARSEKLSERLPVVRLRRSTRTSLFSTNVSETLATALFSRSTSRSPRLMIVSESLSPASLMRWKRLSLRVASRLTTCSPVSPMRLRDRLAAAGEEVGDALGGAVGGDRDLVGDAGEVGGEGIVRAADRLAHALGVLHDRLALGDELVDQPADAELVVGVGALERGDLVVHQHFELARPRQRALDAVAHRGDFAADGLADGDDGFLGDVLRLGEAQRHFGHGARDDAHFLAAPDQDGDAPEEQDRPDDADRQAEQMRRAADALDAAEAGDLVAPDAEAEGDAEAGPGDA